MFPAEIRMYKAFSNQFPQNMDYAPTHYHKRDFTIVYCLNSNQAVINTYIQELSFGLAKKFQVHLLV